MRFWVDIEDASHAIVGDGPITSVTRCTIKSRLSRVGEIAFEMPALDPRAGLVVPRRTCAVYGVLGGIKTYLGGGVIDQVRTRIGSDGQPLLSVSGGDLLRELMRRSVGKLILEDDNPAHNLTALLDLILDDPVNWEAYDVTGTSPNFKARFVYESLLNSIVTLAEKTGALFTYGPPLRLDPPRVLHWFYTPVDSGIVATMHGDTTAIATNPNACLITDIEIVEDSNDLKTRLYLFGAGEGDSVMTAAAAQYWPSGLSVLSTYTVDGNVYSFNRAENYINNDTTTPLYGVDEIALAFKDIAPLTNGLADVLAAANFLVTAGFEYLHKNRMPYKSYKLSVTSLATLLLPGQTILVQARRYRDGQKAINVNEVLTILEVQNTIDVNGIYTSGLVVANMPRWPVNANEEIAREMGNTKIISAHPQSGPNVDTISYREHLDDTHDATLQFWLGEETTNVQSVAVRMRVDPLRSTVKSVGAGSTTTPSGGGGTTPSGGNGTSDITGAAVMNHSHDVEVSGLSVTAGQPVWFNTTNGLHMAGGGGVQSGPGTTLRDLSSHTHGTPVHAHATPNHTHTFTPTITTGYGVFDESPTNTYAATDLEWQTAADSTWTAITSAQAISGAAGWYQLDITARVADTNAPFRPLQAANSVQFRVIAASHAAKSAQITVQIERRTTIQSIAVY